MSSILVTGAAGFIGFHLCQALLQQGHTVQGVDRVNTYYDPKLKLARLEQLQHQRNFTFHQADLAAPDALRGLNDGAEIVYHLAAQAGVRYSLHHPEAYVQSNLVAFMHVLEHCRRQPPGHLIYASSSSVYGLNRSVPFKETDQTDQPASLYAATKKANELLAHSYAHLYGLPATALRFFTVYGPWGRPDMAYYKFAQAILADKPLPLFNQGDMQRDFTYIADVVEAMVKLIPKPPTDRPAHRVLNLGNHHPVSLGVFVDTLAKLMNRPVKKQLLPMQPGDVYTTYASTQALADLLHWVPSTSLEEGLKEFVAWFLSEGKKYDLAETFA